MRRHRFALVAAAGLTGMAMLQGFSSGPDDTIGADEAGLVRVQWASVPYREPGEFLVGDVPTNGPLETITIDKPIEIMARQVTRGEYDHCVAAARCKPLDAPQGAELPAVGLSFYDAVAYAEWLSEVTGEQWRLPTDREWALTAGSRYSDDAYAGASDPDNPARQWIDMYDAEATRGEIDPTPRPIGHFGANEHGLVDVAGNVWDWTSTCYARYRTDVRSDVTTVTENCGIRVAEGLHRAYMIGFFRDPKAGACSVGVPPANLGLRLVRERGRFFNWLGF